MRSATGIEEDEYIRSKHVQGETHEPRHTQDAKTNKKYPQEKKCLPHTLEEKLSESATERRDTLARRREEVW